MSTRLDLLSPRSDRLRVCFDNVNIGEGHLKVNEKSGSEFIFIYRGQVVSRTYIYNENGLVVWGMHQCTWPVVQFPCQFSPPKQTSTNQNKLVEAKFVR